MSSPNKEYPKTYEELLESYKELEKRYEIVKKDYLNFQKKVGVK